MGYSKGKVVLVLSIIAICTNAVVGQMFSNPFGSNRAFSAQNTNFNQNRNGFGMIAIGGQESNTNFNQQQFGAETADFGLSNQGNADSATTMPSQPMQPMQPVQPMQPMQPVQPMQPQPQPAQQPSQSTFPNQIPVLSETMQFRYASPYDMPVYSPKKPAHSYASNSYPSHSYSSASYSVPAPQVNCPSNLMISCKLHVQDAPCQPPSPGYNQY